MIKPHDTREAGALETARRRILEHVARNGAVPLTDLPSRWPLTRHHVRLVARDLALDGMVSMATRLGDRAPVLAITDTGRRTLETKGS